MLRASLDALQRAVILTGDPTGHVGYAHKAADAADLIRRRRFIDRLSCAEGFVLDVIGISAGMKMTLPDKR